MRVFDLRCEQSHLFEGWFGSDDDYEAQQAKGYLTCPICGNAQVRKMLSAPRINLGKGSRSSEAESLEPRDINEMPSGDGHEMSVPSSIEPMAASGKNESLAPDRKTDQVTWIKIARALLANTEDVGTAFADEARKIHDGKAPERAIRGQASPEEKQALREDGIAVIEVALPSFLKETLQ